MTRKQRRLMLISGVLGAVAIAVALALTALQDGVTFFFSPSDVVAKGVAEGQRIRLGGLVEAGSVVRGEGQTVRFAVTDGVHSFPVAYTGVLPDLFREGQGVITQGRFESGRLFVADEVLARHDETYMPPEVARALKESGHWKPGEPPPPGAARTDASPAPSPGY